MMTAGAPEKEDGAPTDDPEREGAVPIVHIVGIDPGLVHTGCVRLLIDTDGRLIVVNHDVHLGADATDITIWTMSEDPKPHVFIEKYRPRSHFGSDERMVKAVWDLKRALPGAKVLDNTGIKTIVTPSILGVLGLTRFSTASHHQDLLSAARIAVLGMMKDEELNKVLATVVRDHLDGNSWRVEHA